MDGSGESTAGAPHLCVLVHGLWGYPAHLSYLKSSIKERFGNDRLHILRPKRNIGNSTYDGIEVCGERVTNEIEERLEQLARDGVEIKKLSVIGYSLGGLVARYAIGLLYHRGWFDRIEPVNFTTFATPHLGVRAPLLGLPYFLWNVLGAQVLSVSGKQLFIVDSFRDTGRPILAVMADPESLFMRALAAFKQRSLYSNIVNDRSAAYYTTSISSTDPFTDLSALKMNYLPDYAPVILDSDNPVLSKVDESESQPTFHRRLARSIKAFFNRLPLLFFFTLFIPIGSVLFLVNSMVQSVRSRQRIQLHLSGGAGIGPGIYNIPLMVENAQRTAEDMYENVNSTQENEYLPPRASEETSGSARSPLLPSKTSVPTAAAAAAAAAATGRGSRRSAAASSEEKLLLQQNGRVGDGDGNGVESTGNEETDHVAVGDRVDDGQQVAPQKHGQLLEFPTLALAPAQFAMIQALDQVGWKKHRVYIHNVRHSHAAIIVRMNRWGFDEGKVVVKHWLDGFEI